MVSKRCEEKLSWKEKHQVTEELKAFGLDSRQIRFLMKHRGRVTEMELMLMCDLPIGKRGNRPTINVVRNYIRTCKTLHLIK